MEKQSCHTIQQFQVWYLPKEWIAESRSTISTPTFVAAQCTIAKMEKWIKKIGHIPAMECLFLLKKEFCKMQNLKDIMLSKLRHSQKDKGLHDPTHLNYLT